MQHDGKYAGGSGDHQSRDEQAGAEDGAQFAFAAQAGEDHHRADDDANQSQPRQWFWTHSRK